MWDGACEKFADINCDSLIHWVLSIPLDEWPHDVHRTDRQPTMANESWRDLKTKSAVLIGCLAPFLNGAKIDRRHISIVMPGHDVFPHKDQFDNDWLYRVHVPLVTNEGAVFMVEDHAYHLKVGSAYKVNVSKRHSVANNGAIPRIHFMFDCYDDVGRNS